jgi:CBS domain-containing protein
VTVLAARYAPACEPKGATYTALRVAREGGGWSAASFVFSSGQVVPHYDELINRTVADVMTEAVVHVDPTAPLTRVLALMVSLKVRSFPVLNLDRQLAGIISREDIVRALKETTREQPSK